MHPLKQQYLQGQVQLNRRSVMRHQLPQNVLDLPQPCLFIGVHSSNNSPYLKLEILLQLTLQLTFSHLQAQ